MAQLKQVNLNCELLKMKKYYHICYTSHQELLLRTPEDYYQMVNRIALTAHSLGADVLADAELSTHVHLVVITDSPVEFLRRLRQSYTKYFNDKYHRSGRLGDKAPFAEELCGKYRLLAALTYVMRQGVHHFLSTTPFGYEFCSSRSVFGDEFRWNKDRKLCTSRMEIAKRLPKRRMFPDSFVMDENGMVTRESFEGITYTENIFGNASNYLYQLGRITDERWIEDQRRDDASAPFVTLSSFERGFSKADVDKMMTNERGYKFNSSTMSDVKLCELVDGQLISKYRVKSVYQLTPAQRDQVAVLLKHKYHINESRIDRCLPVQS